MNQTYQPGISPIVIHLLKGVLTRDDQEKLWHQLMELEGPVRDYLSVVGLEIVIAEDEGYAYLTQRQSTDGEPNLPRLVTRRALSYPVSLVLALLRRRLAEHDASSHEPRLILDTRELAHSLATFLPEGKTEARVVENIENHLKKVAELGFIRFLGQSTEKFEVRRILKAYIDAQWLGEFDQRLAEYRMLQDGSGQRVDNRFNDNLDHSTDQGSES
jgi:hypothetical protein